jgi:L-ascorbate metabolism protein UlaG (beta-lactamase superfamily)
MGMRVRRLGWAGIEIEARGQRAVIDAITTMGPMEQFVGPAREPLLPPSGPVDLALVTHLHRDHTDAAAIAAALAPDGAVLRPEPATGDGPDLAGTAWAEADLLGQGVTAQVVRPWESVRHGPFTATAVPAIDGFGDPQVSWVLAVDGHRILHGGDTLFHGNWWSIAARLGPFDAVFLPVNGAVCDFPHRQPASPFPACLDPAQAAVAAIILRPRLAVPIHYDTMYRAPVYQQVDDPGGTFVAASTRAGVPAVVLAPGEALDLAAVPV